MPLVKSPELGCLSAYLPRLPPSVIKSPQQLVLELRNGKHIFDTVYVDKLIHACEQASSTKSITRLLLNIAGGDTYHTSNEYNTPEHKNHIRVVVEYMVRYWLIDCKAIDALEILPELFSFIDMPLQTVLTLYVTTFSFTTLKPVEFHNLFYNTLVYAGWYLDMGQVDKDMVIEHVRCAVSQLISTSESRRVVETTVECLLKN